MDGSPSSFGETLAAARCGEEWAVARLWRDLNARLLRFLRVRHDDSYEDVASETWLRVTQSLHRFTGDEDDFRAWFFTVAHGASVDWYRRAARRPATVADSAVPDHHGAVEDAAQVALDGIDTDAALALLGQLPHAQAEVILLRVVAGLDAEHVGRIVGKRAGAVRVLQHRGLRRLAELLGSAHPQGTDVTRRASWTVLSVRWKSTSADQRSPIR
jgi:RNA polymerase sigma-70 factor (ECF subfamily)